MQSHVGYTSCHETHMAREGAQNCCASGRKGVAVIIPNPLLATSRCRHFDASGCFATPKTTGFRRDDAAAKFSSSWAQRSCSSSAVLTMLCFELCQARFSICKRAAVGPGPVQDPCERFLQRQPWVCTCEGTYPMVSVSLLEHHS